ncbi:MAG: Trk family potassium uptake protein [Clostridia bacterium]|nr:Trk family potassium uptake protein [Clostridia bacterium]
MKKKLRIRFTHTQIIALGFLIVILMGTLLLMLPVASRDGRSTPFFDCLFTSTSAACVTGLIITDTASHWSVFGQIVILVLIQIGGLGFMTLITFFFMLMRRRVGLQERQIMTESINASNIGEILGLTKVILIGTVIFELSGAALLAIRFIPRFGVLKGIWFSIFHAVSAFCNAGFDIMGSGGNSVSLTEYAADPLVNIVVMVLIIVGGLGFLVWDDLRKHKFRWKRYRLQTKCVLFMTAVLVLGGAILYFIFERNATGAGRPLGERVLTAFFSSVTARTAGFNTTDTASLSGPSTVLSYILMFIGGNSGSTAGGVKTTSVLVVLVFAICGIRREHGANIFGRRLNEDSLRQAVYIIAANLSAAILATLVIGAIQDFPVDQLLFETFSAIGTVGISAGITSSLNLGSRLVIILLMYMGRVGSISFGLALLEKKARPAVTYPTESVIVG